MRKLIVLLNLLIILQVINAYVLKDLDINENRIKRSNLEQPLSPKQEHFLKKLEEEELPPSFPRLKSAAVRPPKKSRKKHLRRPPTPPPFYPD